MTPTETLEAARQALTDLAYGIEDEPELATAPAEIEAALTLLASLLTPPDEAREREIAERADGCGNVATVEVNPIAGTMLIKGYTRPEIGDASAIKALLENAHRDIPYLLSRLAALRARVAEVEGERQRWADIATERKIDLQNADALAYAVRCALGGGGGGATGWVPGRGVDTLIDLALDIRAERDSLAAIRRYLEAAVQLGADTSGREDVAAEWEAIPLDDRERLEAWGNRVCNAGIEAGEDEAEELRDERDNLRRELEEARLTLLNERGEGETDALRVDGDLRAYYAARLDIGDPKACWDDIVRAAEEKGRREMRDGIVADLRDYARELKSDEWRPGVEPFSPIVRYLADKYATLPDTPPAKE